MDDEPTEELTAEEVQALLRGAKRMLAEADDFLQSVERYLPDYGSLRSKVGNSIRNIRTSIQQVEAVQKGLGKTEPTVEPNLSEKRGAWRGCTMINPLAPSDFCDLPAGHYGSGEGKHRPCTVPAGELLQMADTYVLSDAKTLDEVIKHGWEAHNKEVTSEHTGE